MKGRSEMLFLLLVSLTLQVSGASRNWLHDELSLIHQEIDSLRGENHNQNIQIALLKEKAGLQDELDHLPHPQSTDLPKNMKAAIIKESSQQTSKGFHHRLQEKPAETLLPFQFLHRQNNSTEKKISSDLSHHRQARPYRLLPSKPLLYDRKNGNEDVDKDQQQAQRFYGQPTNCSDLSLLGYTLNGFYLVKSSNPLNTTGLQIETVFCSFRQPDGHPFNPFTLEKRVGLFKLDKISETGGVDKESPINSTSNTNNSDNNSSGRIMFHLQIKNSSNITQKIGDRLEFDLILYHFENCYKQKNREFVVPITGNYKFVFEGKILAKSIQNITFGFAGRYRPPEYKHGSILKTVEVSDITNNTAKIETTKHLSKSSKVQLKTYRNPDKTTGTYILSADNFTSFRAYLMP